MSQTHKQVSIKILLLLGIAGAALLAGCGGSSATSLSGQGGGGGTNPQPTIITVQFPAGSTLPTAVATQVGTGAWTAATLQNGQFTISVPSGTQNYSYAYACAPSLYESNGTVETDAVQEFILEQSVQDGTSVTAYFHCNSPSTATTQTLNTVTLNVDATAIPNTANIIVQSSLGYQSIPGNSGTVSMGLVNGTSNFAVIAADKHFNPLATYILRSQTIPGQINGGNPVVFNAGDELSAVPVTYQNSPSGWGPPYLFALYFTSGGIGIDVSVPQTLSGSTAYDAVPASQQQSGDFYYLAASINGQTQTGIATVSTYVETSATSPLTTSFAFPAPLPTSDAAPTAATWPTFNIAYPGFSDTSLTSTGTYGFMQWLPDSSSNPPKFIYALNISATSTYLNGATTFAVPDLSAVPGFLSAPSSGTSVYWLAGVYGQNFSFVSPAPTNNKNSQATISGIYTAP